MKLNSSKLQEEIRPAMMNWMHGFVVLCRPPFPHPSKPPTPRHGMRAIVCAWSIRPHGPNPEIILITHHGLN